MSCCGDRRQQFFIETEQLGEAENIRKVARQAPSVNNVPVYFEYTGTTALTAEAPISGRRYRFAEPGASMAVDRRDAPSLAAIPLLRRAKKTVAGNLE